MKGSVNSNESSVPITFPYYPKKPEKVYLKEEKNFKSNLLGF